MEIKIQAIHFDVSERLETFIRKKVSKLEQFHDGILTAEVNLRVIKPETAQNKQAGVRVKIKNNECFAEKISDTFEEAVDHVADALERQLIKLKKGVNKKTADKFWNVINND
ncbi:MAG: ribosome-associated translation inhibitor RaiA [Tannerella sp.]|jgi:putative sigma-54 modulation protein|nr:ribosome-associated translation inhibitor RaiA [Tannerella sp.]